MADKAAKVEVVTSTDELPGGLIPEHGESESEAMEGLFEALGSEDEFLEETESDDSPTGDDEDEESEEGAGSEAEDEDSGEEAEDTSEDEVDDESDDDGNDSDEDGEELTDDTVVKGVPLPGGETTEVTLKELKDGYSRQADYTRKRQAAVEEHAGVMTEVRDIRDQYSAKLDQVTTILNKMGPQMPDAALRTENPGEYAAQVADHQAFQDSLGAISGAKEAVTVEEQQEAQDAQQVYVQQEWGKLLERVPEWANDETATKDLTALRQFAIEDYGFAPDEIDNVVDSRLLLMLKRNYDLQQTRVEAKEKVEDKKAQSKQRLGPGGRKTKASAKSRKKKQQRSADRRAQTSGSVNDAARAIELALDDLD